MFEDQKKEEGKDDKGRFVSGNKFWHRRARSGTYLKFETPEILEQACFDYFEWVDENPLKEDKVFGTGFRAKVNHPRAMTIGGLCIFLPLARRSWDDYREREGFKEVCEMVEEIIYEQKFSGAAAGLFNAAIIARDLGLADKRDLLSSDGSMTPKVTTYALPDNGRD